MFEPQHIIDTLIKYVKKNTMYEKYETFLSQFLFFLA